MTYERSVGSIPIDWLDMAVDLSGTQTNGKHLRLSAKVEDANMEVVSESEYLSLSHGFLMTGQSRPVSVTLVTRLEIIDGKWGTIHARG